MELQGAAVDSVENKYTNGGANIGSDANNVNVVQEGRRPPESGGGAEQLVKPVVLILANKQDLVRNRTVSEAGLCHCECLYVCVFVFLCMFVCFCEFLSLYINFFVCFITFLGLCFCVCLGIFVCLSILVNLIIVYFYVCVHVYACIPVFLCTFGCVHLCVCGKFFYVCVFNYFSIFLHFLENLL